MSNPKRSAGGGSFLDEIALGRYIEGDSPFHKAGTGWKFAVLTLVATLTFLFQSASAFVLVGGVTALVACQTGLPQLLFWRSLRPVNLLALFTLLAGAFINHSQASPLHPAFSWEGLHTGGLYAARLVLLTLLTTLFFLTTRPADAIKFGIFLLKPLKWVGIEQHELSLLVHLAYRFVPLLRKELKEFAAGRLARNLPSPKGPLGKAKQAREALIFLFVGALHRAETTGLALEQRRVVEEWHSDAESPHTGLGGWMSVLFLLAAGIALWKDPLML
jgi:energy-coupling factor transporter transmembrane protein EcfT